MVVRTTSRLRSGRPYALVDQSEMLDLLTPLQQGSGTDVLSLASLFTGGLGGVAVLVVTGPRGPSTVFSHGAPENTRSTLTRPSSPGSSNRCARPAPDS